MKNAIWFSRHEPTSDQLIDAKAMGYRIVAISEGKQLGAIELKDNGDVKAVVSGVLALVDEHDGEAIFGVAPTPIQGQFARTTADAVQRAGFLPGDVPFFAAWNAQRSVAGEKPTFLHRQWVLVGHLSQASTRWLG